ncbi:PREDICTED: flotillin-1-like [Priapulus caudatus]|uniref:Flotillin-1-like n=1 Tax=Priapulus caudatus TaxID=37621 RepID=A0ABM1EDK1_PRICU|nr:PREDICTED: flotillin-1-like [Priapulus caudatus]
MTLAIESSNVYTALGVAISVSGVAQVKVHGQNKEMLEAACQQFLGKSDEEVENIAKETLEGHQRAIMGNMTVEGYLSSLGQARIAEVTRDARIGEAEATRDSEIRKSLATEQTMRSKYENDIEIARAKREFELNQAIYQTEINMAKAHADLAYDLQAAKTQQKIMDEKMQIKVVERSQQIAVQEQEILRREKELEGQVRRPAEAEKYRLEMLAQAKRNQTILQAEAVAESIRVKGEAEAFAIEAKAKAEAEQMAKKADAWLEYKEAAMVDMVLDILPEIIANVTKPLKKTNRIVMVSSGNSDVGASKLTGEVINIVNQLPTIAKSMTGLDVSSILDAAQKRA